MGTHGVVVQLERARLRRLRGGGDLLSKDAPGNVGAQVFTPDLSLRRSLDGRAKLSRNLAVALEHLADELRAAVDGTRQGSAAATNGINRSFNVLVHGSRSIKHCCMVRPALHERKGCSDNPAMLDKRRTAELLKESLHEAFAKWSAASPRQNTKAELARLCAKRRPGVACTPQTVSGWFSTGRMDKGWIRVVEAVLEQKLNFDGAELPESGAEQLAATPQEIETSQELISLIQDVKDALLDPELADMVADLREKVAARREFAMALERRKGSNS